MITHLVPWRDCLFAIVDGQLMVARDDGGRDRIRLNEPGGPLIRWEAVRFEEGRAVRRSDAPVSEAPPPAAGRRQHLEALLAALRLENQRLREQLETAQARGSL